MAVTISCALCLSGTKSETGARIQHVVASCQLSTLPPEVYVLPWLFLMVQEGSLGEDHAPRGPSAEPSIPPAAHCATAVNSRALQSGKKLFWRNGMGEVWKETADVRQSLALKL
jgi:hypothetical protein